MEPIVSTPHSGDPSRPLTDGHSPDLLIEDLAAYEVAFVPFEPTAEFVAEQVRILHDELALLLTEQAAADANPATAYERAEALPGFETLTATGLRLCPSWCVHADLPVHGDGFEQDPDSAPHRSVEHTVHAIHGGEGIGHAGRADVALQLEQDRDLSTGPGITLSVVVQGIEQYTWLALPEARAVHQAIGYLITEADG